MRQGASCLVLRALCVLCAWCLGVVSAHAQAGVFWPSERAPRPLAPREVKFPPYATRTLANGLQVVVVEHHEQPAISVRLLVKAGAAQDPPGKGGIGTLAAALLDQGTTTKSAEQIADEIDFIGGALATGAGPDLTFVNAVVMKDSFAVGLALVNDVVRHPGFAAEEIDRQKQQAISSLRVSSRDPDYIADSVFDRLVYGFHPYGLPPSGTPESLEAITRADLQAYHRQFFVPNNAVLAVVGDVVTADVFATVERTFGEWPRSELAPQRPVAPPPPARRIVVIDVPGAVQTEIRAGMLAIPRKHPDYLAWDLAVKILGGEGANRLHQVLRAQRGLTYGASADTESRKQAGDFVAETDTRTETTGQALRLMIEEFARLQRDRVGQGELGGAQDYLAGSFPLTIETPNQIATQILNVLFYELPVSEIGSFRERVISITPDDIQRVAREYVKPDLLSIVLVGDARSFMPQLAQLGFSGMEVIALDDLDVMSATLKKPTGRAFGSFGTFGSLGSFGAFRFASFAPQRAGAAAPAPSPVPVQAESPSQAVLRRVVQAKGGLAALKNVRTVAADARTTLRMEQGPLTSTTRTYVVYPDKFRVDATVSGAEVVQVYNAGTAWVKDPSGVHDAPAAMRADFAGSVQRDIIPLLIAAAEGRLTTTLLPDDKRTVPAAFKVLEITGPQQLRIRLQVDDQGVIASQAYTALGPDGRPLEAEETFADYRTVEGIRIPFTATLLRNGRPILDRVLTRVVINGAVEPSMFIRPR